MNQSENIADLVHALSKAQKVMAGAKKDAKGNFGKFADLTSCWEALREPLAENGLAVVQTTSNIGLDGVNVITTLAHSGGQWIRGELFLPAMKKDPQGFGSALTYARRYALAAICGLAPADDDAQSVTDNMRNQSATSKVATAKPKVADISVESLKKAAAKGTEAFRKAWKEMDADNRPNDPAIINELKEIAESADSMIATQA